LYPVDSFTRSPISSTNVISLSRHCRGLLSITGFPAATHSSKLFSEDLSGIIEVEMITRSATAIMIIAEVRTVFFSIIVYNL